MKIFDTIVYDLLNELRRAGLDKDVLVSPSMKLRITWTEIILD
jgi:hypothetical protein